MHPHIEDRYAAATTVENAAAILGSSYSLVRLAIDGGCHHRNGLVIPAEVIGWITMNLSTFREMAGLSALPRSPLESGNEDEQVEAAVRQVLLTTLQYQAARCSVPAMKKAYEIHIASYEAALLRQRMDTPEAVAGIKIAHG